MRHNAYIIKVKHGELFRVNFCRVTTKVVCAERAGGEGGGARARGGVYGKQCIPISAHLSISISGYAYFGLDLDASSAFDSAMMKLFQRKPKLF
ncbi:hypothetical protein EVAR_79578_1 [Eumeta japonica]|uniref:Uncharacterized protein n=1 Tax=Eumeta variegata TaxID=151549 RepID=A0A4C1UE54_EUMVA|nr:hypothetical protein EVAR_79578_1 [Eumeta japonica]